MKASEQAKWARLQELSDVLSPCRNYGELDQALDSKDLLLALKDFPKATSATLYLYAYHRERIQGGIENLPASLEWERVVKSAYRLASVHLRRIGFLAHFVERPDGFAFRINLEHPHKRSSDGFKRKNAFLYRTTKRILFTYHPMLAAFAQRINGARFTSTLRLSLVTAGGISSRRNAQSTICADFEMETGFSLT